jgi:hypothetical protein
MPAAIWMRRVVVRQCGVGNCSSDSLPLLQQASSCYHTRCCLHFIMFTSDVTSARPALLATPAGRRVH